MCLFIQIQIQIQRIDIIGHQKCGTWFQFVFQNMVGPKKISLSQGIHEQNNLKWWILGSFGNLEI